VLEQYRTTFEATESNGYEEMSSLLDYFYTDD